MNEVEKFCSHAVLQSCSLVVTKSTNQHITTLPTLE